MYGTWSEDPRGGDLSEETFEIPMHGLGLFACRRTAWAGFNPEFRGFGGEEGYIHEKMRRCGGRILCLPFLRWVHRFERPLGLPYVNRWEDRIRNYFLGFMELGLDTEEMEIHFAELLGQGTSTRIFSDIKTELAIRPPTGPRQARTMPLSADYSPSLRFLPEVNKNSAIIGASVQQPPVKSRNQTRHELSGGPERLRNELALFDAKCAARFGASRCHRSGGGGSGHQIPCWSFAACSNDSACCAMARN
jgi:hypothetical protein